MSACGQCGFALEQGAAHCGGCGAPVPPPAAEPQPAAPVEKWGTLIRAPRPVTGPLTPPESPGSADALPQPRLPVVRHSSGPLDLADAAPIQGSLAAEASAQAARARAPSA